VATVIREIEGVGPVTAEALLAFEALLGCRLPPEYRSFLQAHNGGAPDPSAFRPPDGDEAGESEVEIFFFLTDKPVHESLARQFEWSRSEMPHHLIPIGEDAFGNRVCLAVRGPNAGRVYFWDHEEAVEEEQGEAGIHLLAESFGAFIDGLFKQEFVLAEPGHFAACRAGDVDAVRGFLDAGGNVNERNEWGASLAETAVAEGHFQVLELLVRRGAVLAGVLLCAARNDRHEMVQFLVANGADPNERDGMGRTPLMMAALASYHRTVAALVAMGADATIEVGTEEDRTLARDLAQGPNADKIRELLDRSIGV
jgi:hypothetical protein